MDAFLQQVLALVEQILTYFKELDAAGIIEMIKNFFAGIMPV